MSPVDLAEPVSLQPLIAEQGAYVSPSGERYEIEGRVVRLLRNIDPALTLELETQARAANDYSDPRFLMPRYERDMAQLALVELFGGRPPTGRVLDVGCGIGILGRLFPNLGLTGVDASIDLLRQVQEGYDLLIEASAEALPFAQGTFDVVVALNMLHHVIDPERAAREFARVLRPGGTLVCLDPRKVAPVELAKQILRGKDDSFAPTHKAFTVEEYDRIIQQAGLRIDERRRVGILTLLAMGGLDATKLSFQLPAQWRDTVVNLLRKTDVALFKLPGVSRLGLNLALRSTRV